MKVVVISMGACKDVELLRDRLRRVREPYVKAILVFGSKARGESGERSDVDLLVLHEGCRIKDPVMRRRHLYNLLVEALGEEFGGITLVDMELDVFLKPVEISSLLLNIYCDAIVVYDETGIVESFLKDIKGGIVRSGLKRVRDGKSYYWILPKPLKEVKIL
ncbi:nucleotidyltransferase domain-containing protein [Candidatus Bathyarchaeota archaeon]|nr:nucleotidyltransferase domain-containing protein [Candidatus Bathyarchaeota archaeon]